MKELTQRFLTPGADPAAAPIQQTDRIRIIDAVRGIALLGILMMNIPYFGMPYMEVFDLRVRDEFSGANYYTWWTVNGLFEGTMRGLFSLLFGAGCYLIIQKLEKKQVGLYAADIYYRRLIWLILFGMFNAFILNWPGDILFNYGVCGLFVFPFRNMRPRRLLIIGVVMLAISTLLSTVPMYLSQNTRQEGQAALAAEAAKQKLTKDQQEAKEAWLAAQKKRTVTELRQQASEEKARMQGNYLSVMAATAPFSLKFETIKLYKAFFWDAIAFMFLGIWLLKTGFLTAAKRKRVYLGTLVIGYAAGLSINYYFLQMVLRIQFDFSRVADEIFFNPYQLKRLFLAMGHLSLILLVFKMNVIPGLYKALAAVGQMAFSNYLMQTIICSLVFYGYGLRWFGEFERYQLYMVTAGVWTFQIAFSNLWLKRFRFGPFEWLWRSLTYWQRQPLRRSTARGRELNEPVISTVTVVGAKEKSEA